MTIQNLKELEGSAPKMGYCLCYLRTAVKFFKYASLDEVKNQISDQAELLELHLFDSDTEYRALSTTSERFKEGYIEHLVSDPYYKSSDRSYGFYDVEALIDKGEDDHKYKELPGTIKLRNYYKYNESDALMIIDYRLFMEDRNVG